MTHPFAWYWRWRTKRALWVLLRVTLRQLIVEIVQKDRRLTSNDLDWLVAEAEDYLKGWIDENYLTADWKQRFIPEAQARLAALVRRRPSASGDRA